MSSSPGFSIISRACSDLVHCFRSSGGAMSVFRICLSASPPPGVGVHRGPPRILVRPRFAMASVARGIRAVVSASPALFIERRRRWWHRSAQSVPPSIEAPSTAEIAVTSDIAGAVRLSRELQAITLEIHRMVRTRRCHGCLAAAFSSWSAPAALG